MRARILMIVMLIAAFAGGAWLGPGWLPGSGDSGGGKDDQPAEREILYWVAPMDPNFRRDKPGKSPMGMDLVPVYADQADPGEGVTISPAVVNNLGVRTAVVNVRPLWRRVEATGYVGFDETRISHVNTRTAGWIVRLPVASEGDRVKKGDLLFEFYSPELVNAQKEYLQATQRGEARLLAGAEEKLRALGMAPSEVQALAQRKSASENIRILAPQDGVVAALNVREGMYIQPNTAVMSLADLSSVWLQAEVFESQAEWVAEGQAAEARLNYMPGTVFGGQVDYVYPVLDPATRTLRVRLRFDNPEERLKPNMYARVSIYGRLRPQALSIPREALIRAPERDRVVLAVDDGEFHVHEVLTGMESGDWVEILAGIEEGDRVVTSAQFLIDSEASLAGSIHRLDQAGTSRGTEEPLEVIANGWIEAIDTGRRKLRVSHGPIDALGWPGMTMDFDVAQGVDLRQLEDGQDIQFVLRQRHAGDFMIEQASPRGETVNIAPGGNPDEARKASGQATGMAAEPESFEEYSGMATVREVSVEERRLRLAHDPIEALGWPAMTMNFGLADSADISGLEPGQRIHFVMRKVGERYLVSEIHPMDSGKAAEEAGHD